MPLTGTENSLSASIDSAIRAAITANEGTAPANPNVIDSLAEGIANAVIPHIVSNAQVLPGTFVAGANPVTGIGALL